MHAKLRWFGVVLALTTFGPVVAGCDDDGDLRDGGVDSGRRRVDSGPPDSGRTDTGPPDTGAPSPSILAEDQTLDLSTVVVVASAVSAGAGWVVINEDEAGAPGAVIGVTAVSAGENADVAVELDRPLVTGEVLHAVLHADAGTVGAFEPATDLPVEDEVDASVADTFVATVPDGTPAIRVGVMNVDVTAWDFTSVEPARYANTIGPGDQNETLLLRRGWRYEVVNAAPVEEHPFQLIRELVTDVVMASQGPTEGPLETDESVAWSDADGAVRFTVSPAFEDAITSVNGYRCGVHTADMRGAIEYVTP